MSGMVVPMETAIRLKVEPLGRGQIVALLSQSARPLGRLTRGRAASPALRAQLHATQKLGQEDGTVSRPRFLGGRLRGGKTESMETKHFCSTAYREFYLNSLNFP